MKLQNNVYALLRLPGQPVEAFGGNEQVQSTELPNAAEQEHFLYAPFREGGAPYFSLPDRLNSSEVINAVDQIQQNLPESTELSETGKSEYAAGAEKLMIQLRSGHLRKAVLSRVKTESTPKFFSATQFFTLLCETYPNAAVHLFAIGKKEIWLGASPERLIEIRDSKLETVSLAGTRKIVNQSTDLVKWGAKEKEEQQMVTDYISDVLDMHKDIAGVEQRGPETATAGNVAHLATWFSAEIPAEFDWLRMVSQLHPTPAICGLPRDQALLAIEQIEKHERLYYGGFFGKSQKNRASLYLNLRCMRMVKNELQFFVGGGYTASSDIDAEWAETEHKAETLLSVIEKLRNFESS